MHFLQSNDVEVAEDIDVNQGRAGRANEIVHMRVLSDQSLLPIVRSMACYLS